MINIQEITDTKSYPLLLLGDEWQIDNALKSYRGQLRPFIQTIKYDEFLNLKNKNQIVEKFEFIILFYSEDKLKKFFNSIIEVKHKTEFLLIIEDENIDLKKIINDWSIVKIIFYSDFESPEWEGSAEIVRKIEAKKERKEIIKKTIDQKKQLDELILRQELSVSEKTSDIEFSNKEQDSKLKKERIILRFIKDLALINSYEDFLRNIKNEFKVFHELGDVILFQAKGNGTVSVLTAKNSFSWKELNINRKTLEENIAANSINLSTAMANFFSRPFGKLFLSQMSGAFYLGFENQFSDKSFQEFKEFFDDRNEVIYMALDKLFSELSMNQFSYRWEKTFDAIKEPIAIIDKNYNVLRSNVAFENHQHTLKCYELFAAQSEPCAGCPLLETIEKNQPTKKDLFLNHKNYQVFSYPMQMKSDIKSVVHTYRDRTQEKTLYSKMLQTEKLLSIGRLAGHLSHELNNPLTGIRSMVQILKSQVQQNHTNFTDLIEIEKATDRCFKVLNNFMDFSNPKKIKSEPVDISDVVNKTIPLLKVALRNHNLKLQLNSQKQKILADPNMLQHVIFNLVNNSTQALKSKGEIIIETQTVKNKVILVVADSGEGIPKEIQNFIFEPFFTTKPEGEGTGLGLSIVKNIVESTQGKISYQDNNPKGAKFIIEWPVYENSNH